MFQRFTEKARRAIFYSFHEAAQLGATRIEPEHILLGLLREDKLLQIVFRLRLTQEEVRNYIRGGSLDFEPISGSDDMPLSASAKQVLTTAAKESDRLRHLHIGTEHLLLALIKAEDSLASRLLHARGVRAELLLAFIESVKPQPEETGLTGEQGVPGGIAGGVIGGLTGRLPVTDDFFSQLAKKSGMTELQTSFNLLLDLLVQKGVITEEEKRGIIKPQDS